MQTAACPAPDRDWILVRFDTPQADGVSDEAERHLQQRVIEHLRAEFGNQHIDVCASRGPSARPSLATLRIGRDVSNLAVVRASADDAVTQKELTRRLSLEGLPEDAHAMAIALGASELLSASWVELRLESHPPFPTAVPPSVQQRIDETREARPRLGDFSILGATEVFAGGVKQFGMDVQVAYAITPNLDAVGHVGGRSALSTTAPHGEISADGWIVGAGADYVVARPASTMRLMLEGRCDFMWLDFNAVAKKDAAATSASGGTWWLSGGLGLDARVAERVAIGGAVLAGRVMLPLSASDDGVKVVGTTKGLVAMHAGVKILF